MGESGADACLTGWRMISPSLIPLPLPQSKVNISQDANFYWWWHIRISQGA